MASDAEIDAAARVFCCGLPIAADDRSKTLAGQIARGRCWAPGCDCWHQGREVTRAALEAAERVRRTAALLAYDEKLAAARRPESQEESQ